MAEYPACFYREIDGQYSVIFPDLNYLSTCGESLREAMNMATDCLTGYLMWCQEDGSPIPKASPMAEIDPVAISKQLDPNGVECETFVRMISANVNVS